MKLAVIGSRDFENYGLVRETLDSYEDIECIVSGGAAGADTLAENYARAHKVKMQVFLPDYELHGRKAPFMRNYQIIDEADEVVAFWDGESKGTKHSIDYAKKQEKPVRIVSTKEI